MRIGNFLNPAFIVRNRSRIVPYIQRRRDEIVYPWTLWPFKNRHRGERCFIIGNGPSLRISDLDKLKGETTFAANKIYLAFEKTDWRPSYYVVEDNYMIQQHHEEIRQLDGIVKFINNSWGKLFRGEDQTFSYPRQFLQPNEYPMFSDNASRAVYCGYTVTYISLQLAYFFGFDRVYLVGVDFDYSELRDGLGAFRHEAHHATDHFTLNYFEPGEMRATPQPALAQRAMVCAKDFYEAHNRQILNATRGGKLEVFKRVSLDDVLKTA